MQFKTYPHMKKTTTKHFSKKLARYGALTAAIAGMADAHGQINFTDIDPDHSGGVGNDYFLDLNNDGTNDFRIHHDGGSNLFISPTAANNQVLGSGTSSTYAYPYALSNGAVISAGATGGWFNNGYSGGFQSMNYGSCSYGNWCDISDKYLGLRFEVGGNLHYAWVQLDVDTNGASWTVKEYAYNETPDQAITAGQETLGLNTPSIETVRIVALNKSIGLYNLNNSMTYTLYSMTGQKVLTGTTSESMHVIEATTAASGVYLIELEDQTTRTRIKKKIIL